MIMTQQIPIYTQCGDMYIMWTQRTNGKKQKVVSIRLEFIFYKAHLKITMFCLLMMLLGLVPKANGK